MLLQVLIAYSEVLSPISQFPIELIDPLKNSVWSQQEQQQKIIIKVFPLKEMNRLRWNEFPILCI